MLVFLKETMLITIYCRQTNRVFSDHADQEREWGRVFNKYPKLVCLSATVFETFKGNVKPFILKIDHSLA